MKAVIKSNLGVPTPSRIENIVKLINAMREREMSIVDMAETLGHSKSGARKYCDELRKHDIISIVRYVPGRTKCRLDKPMYELNPNVVFVQAYIDVISLIGMESRDKAIKRQMESKTHVMKDDAVFKIKRASFEVPKHTDLMSALFGMNKEAA